MRTLEVASSPSGMGRLRGRRIAPSNAGAPTGLPRPSWSASIVATAAIAGITWGIARQQTNEIDPRHVVAVNLTAAKLAIDDARLVEPAEHSAAYYYRIVLTIDPTNETARSGLSAVAEELLTAAKDAILSARFADAVAAIDSARRIAPEHRRIAFLETELRKALDAHAASVRSQRELGQESALQPKATEHDTKTTQRSKQKAMELVEAPVVSNARGGDLPSSSTREDDRPNHDTREARDTSFARAPAAQPTVVSREQQYLAANAAFQLARSTLHASIIPAAIQPELQPITVSAERVAPKIATLVEPDYPEAARVRGIEGWVDLTLSVAAGGNVVDARVEGSKGTRSFERAALAAVRQWRYEAMTGDTASRDVPVRVEFRLEK